MYSGYSLKVELIEPTNWLDLGKEKEKSGWFPGFYLSNYMKAGAICFRQSGLVLDILSSGCLLDIQKEWSIRKLDRSLEDEERGHTGEESFWVTSVLA